MMPRLAVFTLIAIAVGFLLYWLSGVLLPFVAGILIAYFLDPVADALERRGTSRTVATTVITVAFFVVLGVLAVVLFPLIQAQVIEFAARLPSWIEKLRLQAEPWLQHLQASFTPEQVAKLREAAANYTGEAAKWLGAAIARLLSGGAAAFHILSLLVITPLVSFYLLRDWDRIVGHFDELLPRDVAPTIRSIVADVDRTIAAWVRGQATVCLFLAVWYGVGLTIIGLEFGLVVGGLTGLISFIPYFGMGIGLVVALAIALAQFSNWLPIAMVTGVFVTGQVIEGYILTPRLVGEKIGLHPVWVIFALLAGGALFGFTGVLLAVPVAAIIGVLVRFGVGRYRESPLYKGGLGGG